MNEESLELEAEDLLEAYRREHPEHAREYDEAIERAAALHVALSRATAATNPREASEWAGKLARDAEPAILRLAVARSALRFFAARYVPRFKVVSRP